MRWYVSRCMKPQTPALLPGVCVDKKERWPSLLPGYPFLVLHAAALPSHYIMANPLNVYRGPNSVRDYFDPDTSPPLPLVEIPDCLNPHRKDGVRIYAKMMSMHPANNVKSMPGSSNTFNCLQWIMC